ncbi:pathogen-related protein [Hibiscus syriacus]|uniref:Pathogen-related protein n=1 Tax=Hibiscus syriacus TaxID=106335 RepID=A0A6A2WEH7_HIBSY|nr:pathogen-related protein [Hibiscus syriacus]
MFMKKWSELDWRLLLLVIVPLSLLFFVFSLSSTHIASVVRQSFIFGKTLSNVKSSRPNLAGGDRCKIAVCLIGGARRFELTGPSIVEKKPMPETEEQVRVLTAANSPNGIQGLLQYFNLVEGCITMIESHQKQHNFTYDWIVRTRVDGYWSAPLHPKNFVAGRYTVPSGSVYGGLNDRLGIGDYYTSKVALSRLSLVPEIDKAGYRQLNSESAFKAQLIALNISYMENRFPFCVVTDRTYEFPPAHLGVPVAAMSSMGRLSGAKCRPCTPVCKDGCVADVMSSLDKRWSWTDWSNGTLELCNAEGGWEKGWEKIFDRVAGEKLGQERKRVNGLMLEECVGDFREMMKRAARWDAPAPEEICGLGLGITQN